MRYVSSFERIATQRGMEKGMEKGISRGQALLLRRQLTRRFGPVSYTHLAARGGRCMSAPASACNPSPALTTIS